ncbi:putative lipase atg15 [Tilletia horrida]|nr:putative lipase atg15 [Tilletia horrida]
MRRLLRLDPCAVLLCVLAVLCWAAASTHAAPATPEPEPAQLLPPALSLAQYVQQTIFSLLPRPLRWQPNDAQPTSPAQHSFTLRHAILHPLSESEPRATYLLNRTTPRAGAASLSSTPLNIRTVRQRILRPVNPRAFIAARAQCTNQDQCPGAHLLDWDEIDIDAPDVSHRETLLAFAKMASQAYENNTDSWVPGFGGFNLASLKHVSAHVQQSRLTVLRFMLQSDSFGWVEDGMRGHVFTSNDNSTIVLAIKGTSPPFFPGGTDTVRRDKENDNLLFSCCCARVSWTWSPVCDCYSGSVSKKSATASSPNTCAAGGLGPLGPSNLTLSALGDEAAPQPTQQCGQTCLERALVEKSVYYTSAMDLYNNVSYLYPDSQIWITGHSLGGSLSALLGMTFGVPTVTFEAPGERMAAQRLHLPLPPTGPDSDESPVASLPITHVYHTADPIAMGDCQGTGSICSSFGYAMESRCHTGKSIIYDTVGALGWGSSINTHRITFMADDLLLEDWNERVAKKKGEKPVHDPGEDDPWVQDVMQGREGWRVIARRKREAAHASKWKWPWQRGDKDKQDDGGHGEDPDGPASDLKRPVPKARNEDACRDCTDWKFADKF